MLTTTIMKHSALDHAFHVSFYKINPTRWNSRKRVWPTILQVDLALICCISCSVIWVVYAAHWQSPPSKWNFLNGNDQEARNQWQKTSQLIRWQIQEKKSTHILERRRRRSRKNEEWQKKLKKKKTHSQRISKNKLDESSNAEPFQVGTREWSFRTWEWCSLYRIFHSSFWGVDTSKWLAMKRDILEIFSRAVIFVYFLFLLFSFLLLLLLLFAVVVVCSFGCVRFNSHLSRRKCRSTWNSWHFQCSTLTDTRWICHPIPPPPARPHFLFLFYHFLVLTSHSLSLSHSFDGNILPSRTSLALRKASKYISREANITHI